MTNSLKTLGYSLAGPEVAAIFAKMRAKYQKGRPAWQASPFGLVHVGAQTVAVNASVSRR